MSRWLVTLALAVVAMPEAGAEPSFRVEHQTRSITQTGSLAARTGPPRIARLPASVELDRDAVLVSTEHGLRIRHSLGRSHGISWIATVGSRLVIGYAARPGGHADSIMAIDHVTGRLAWRRSVDSLAAVSLSPGLLAVERAGALDVLDVRTGGTVGTTPLAGQELGALTRAPSGDLHLKTLGDLIAIERDTGRIRWVQPATSVGNALAAPAAVFPAPSGCVLDTWVDRRTHRYGLVGYDALTGRRLASVALGGTGGWYERERLEISPDGPHDVLVSALFATG